MKIPYRTIGHSIERFGAIEKVTGAARFCADIEMDAPLCLRALRSGRQHAEIARIDTTAAEAVDGVIRVFTAADIPGTNLMGIINKDQPLLATGKVRSSSDAVALVAAESEAAAEKALSAIEVEYRDLPAVTDPEAALAPNAPRIHQKGNLLVERVVKKGDVQAAFADCASIVEKVYRTPFIEHTYLEPDAGTGFIDTDGTMVIYASTQNPHYDHKEVVSFLGVADETVRIIQAATGGGFGSKLDLNVQGFIGLSLFHIKRPVRYVYSREEAYLATAKRHPLIIRLKTGTDQAGRFLAMQADIICDTGAYGSYGIAVASRAAVHITGPYEIPNVDVRSRCIYTNNPFCGAMRGFGAPQAAFAHESQIDLHALDLGLDPLEIRLRNSLTEGSATGTGQVLTASVGMRQCLEAIAPHYETARRELAQGGTVPYVRRGVGIGAMWYGIGNTGVQNPSTARVAISPEGQVSLFTGCADIGQGSTTILVQMVAEILGLRPADIHAVVADTKFTTNAGATSASRQTYISGNAVREAASKLADVLLTEGANRLRAPKSSLALADGFVTLKEAAADSRKIPLAELARRVHAKGGNLSWQGYFDPDTIPLDPSTGQGAPYATYAFACQMARVKVDVLTGEVGVDRIVAAHDVGKAIHPENVIGQIVGGTAMGLGLAILEEFKPGVTESMKDYLIPTADDMPAVDPIIIESPEPTGPFGAKGVGEPALIPTAPAILNGLADALGERIYSLPASLERVLEAAMRAGHFVAPELKAD
ncbi:MAG: xanthine dehydrogenase family protein molybdopterin-binding subunit [Desulfobacterales bacterium]